MSKEDVETKIESIEKHKKKTINVAFDKSQKIRKAIQKHRKKILEDTLKLIDETDPQLTEEGVQKITKKGKIYTSHVKEVIGGPKQPMTREEFLRKFNDCAGYAVRPISSKKLEGFLFLADRLETLNDIREAINLLI